MPVSRVAEANGISSQVRRSRSTNTGHPTTRKVNTPRNAASRAGRWARSSGHSATRKGTPTGGTPNANYSPARGVNVTANSDRSTHVEVTTFGTLTDGKGTGKIAAARTGIADKKISRADVAAVVVKVLEDESTVGKTIQVVGGTTPIVTALSKI